MDISEAINKAKESVEAGDSIFDVLSSINVNSVTNNGQNIVKGKNGLSYLPWAWAWYILKKIYPLSTYTIIEDENGRNYHSDNVSGWVKVGVTIISKSNGEINEEICSIEESAITDYRNNPLTPDRITSKEVLKTTQRCATKAIAREGLGLSLYIGEDIPDASDGTQYAQQQAYQAAPQIQQPAQQTPPPTQGPGYGQAPGVNQQDYGYSGDGNIPF